MKRLIAFGVLMVLCSIVVLAQNPPVDPRIGTWRANLAKSTYSPGPPPKTPLVRRYEARPDGFLLFTQTGVDAEGNPVFTQTAYKIDGKEYPQFTQTSAANFLTAGVKSPVTSSYKLDGQTVILAQKTNGVPAIPITHTVSRDGKTMTVTTKGTDAQGRAINNVVVYDRVGK